MKTFSEAMERGAPDLDRDCYEVAYVVIDNAGSPVSPFYMRLKRAREFREDAGGTYEQYRIIEIGLKLLVDEPEVVDDPVIEELAKKRKPPAIPAQTGLMYCAIDNQGGKVGPYFEDLSLAGRWLDEQNCPGWRIVQVDMRTVGTPVQVVKDPLAIPERITER